jgi:hypothetical protein
MIVPIGFGQTAFRAYPAVIAGLVLAIHVFFLGSAAKEVDARDERGCHSRLNKQKKPRGKPRDFFVEYRDEEM